MLSCSAHDAAPRAYAPRDPARSVLYQLVADQRATFAKVTAEQGHVPSFVDESFERFLRCGVLAHGFARYQCTDCRHDHLVPLSCKGRGLCPSCGGRRMMSITRHVMDAILPHVPTRQWVLTLPHLIGLDGWFYPDAAGELAFTRAPTPTQQEVEALLRDAHVLRLLFRRGLLEADADDALARDAPALSVCYEGAVLQRVGLGPMRGRPVLKLGTSLAQHLASASERVEGAGWLCARLDGFDLHGRVAFGAADRMRLEELVRYCARPPLAYERLTKQADGHYLLRLKTRWRDGTSHLLFEPTVKMVPKSRQPFRSRGLLSGCSRT